MREYLEKFHQHKKIFLRYWAGKSIQREARSAAQQLASDQVQLVDHSRLTAAQKKKAKDDNRKERKDLINKILRDGSHNKFPKIHRISHYADQIERYGSLPQYSTKICESSHKLLKDAYRQSNHVNATPQIIKTYTRTHTFAMHELNLTAWSNELENMSSETKSIFRPTRKAIKIADDDMPTKRKLQGRVDKTLVYDLAELSSVYKLVDLKMLTRIYFENNTFKASRDRMSDAESVLGNPVEAFNTLEIPVAYLDGKQYILHHLLCTGPEKFPGEGPAV